MDFPPPLFDDEWIERFSILACPIHSRLPYSHDTTLFLCPISI